MVRVELDKRNIRSFLKSADMMNLMEGYANQVKTNAGAVGKGYTLNKYVGRNRVNVSIRTRTKEAVKDNLENNTLMKALGSVHD